MCGKDSDYLMRKAIVRYIEKWPIQCCDACIGSKNYWATLKCNGHLRMWTPTARLLEACQARC